MQKKLVNEHSCRKKGITVFIVFLFIGNVVAIAQVHQITKNQVYLFKNGKWFDGKEFVEKDFYTWYGTLHSSTPSRIDAVFDLKGKYVVPPFGEAHNHNLAASPKIDSLIKSYISDGIFYVKNPNSLAGMQKELAGKINRRSTIDVTFANGGLTSSGGHPIAIAERQISYGVWKEPDGEGGFYYIIDNSDDLDRKWKSITRNKPDFIKVYLLYSEEYHKRKADDRYKNWRGLDPRLLPDIVRLAHRSKLRVSAHVETAADFHNALIAGVDEINHLPGFRPEMNDPSNYQNLERYKITGQDAKLAAENGVVVVTTVGSLLESLQPIMDSQTAQAPLATAVKKMIVENLALLKNINVRIAIGSDSYSNTSWYEALKISNAGIFSNLELLKAWCEITPSTIFPGRKIGHLKKGFEASFLVLNNNPLIDFNATHQIVLRVKQGEILDKLGDRRF